jgi:hypothetical protein
MDPRIITSYDIRDPNYHFYEYSNVVCKKGQNGCSRENVFKTMNSQMRFVAPITSSQPVRHCAETILPIKNPIKTTIDDKAYLITNFTLPGHMLYPGKIARRVEETSNAIVVRTIGTGIGGYKKFNQLVAPQAWGSADRQLAREIERTTSSFSSVAARHSCQASVEKVLSAMKTIGARRPHIFSISRGTANQGRSGNPTSRSDELEIAITDTSGEDLKAQKILGSNMLQTWANSIASSCTNTAIISFGIADSIEYFFVQADGKTSLGTCMPRSYEGYKIIPWGKIYSNMECWN